MELVQCTAHCCQGLLLALVVCLGLPSQQLLSKQKLPFVPWTLTGYPVVTDMDRPRPQWPPTVTVHRAQLT